MATPNQININSDVNNVGIQTNDNSIKIVNQVDNVDVNVTQPVTTVIKVAKFGGTVVVKLKSLINPACGPPLKYP